MEFFNFLLEPSVLVALASLAILEIILGIDNVIFIIVLAAKLPEEQRDMARRLGIGMAFISRVLLLFCISWIMGLTAPLFAIPVIDHSVSGRDLILILGGAFLLWKATTEIHDRIEGEDHGTSHQVKGAILWVILMQIMFLDLVFSLDSVITAIGLIAEDPNAEGALSFTQQLSLMVFAVLLATFVMLFAANPIARFIERHPSLKMLAFSFLLLIATTLIAEGFHFHIEKGYIYAAMGFSILVETLHIFTRRNKKHSKKIQPTVENS